jgi:hypothetical protein
MRRMQWITMSRPGDPYSEALIVESESCGVPHLRGAFA